MKGVLMIRTWGMMALVTCVVLAGLVVPVRGQSAAGTEETSSPEALAIYADAASFQNNRAFALAIDEWKKFLKSFPEDPLASKAWYFLGSAYLQSDTPDYQAAMEAFAKAVQDRSLDLRDRSLINLGWCHYTVARNGQEDQQAAGLREAQRYFTEFLKEYPRGEFADQALYYLGEIQYAQGNPSKATSYYQKLLDTPSLKDSTLRPDAQYSLGVAYEELKNLSKASRVYRDFLEANPEHRLVAEVSVRLADILLAQKDPAGAEKILASLSDTQDMADYVLLRSGYALAEQGKLAEANSKYLELLDKYPESVHASAAALSVGQSLFQQGKLDEAAAQFQQPLGKKDALAADAAHWLAVTLLRQNKAKEALEVLEDALEWAPGDQVTLHMDYADALYAMPGQVEKAMSAYQEIARAHPQDPLAPRAAYNAAFAALQLRKFEQARTWSEWFLQRFPQDPLRNDVAYVAAETLLLEGEHESAVTAYTKLLKADPKNPSFVLWTLRLATAHYLAGQYPQAIEVVRTHQARYESDTSQKAEALFVLGASLLYEEQLDEAIRELSASHAASDSWGSADEVLLLLAEAYQRNQNNQAAKETLERLLKKYPQSRLRAQAEYKLGQLTASMGQYGEAIQSYQLIVTNPDAQRYHNFAQYGIAWCLMQQEKYSEALEQLAPLLAQTGQDPTLREAKLARGVCLRKLGRTGEAIDSLKEYLQGEAQGISLGNGLYELGLAYTDQDELDAANEQFQRLLDNVPDYPASDSVLYELAWNLQDKGQAAKAGQVFTRLAEDFPNSEFAAEARYMQAQQQYDAEQYAQAAQTYASVLRSNPDEALQEKTLYKLGWSYFQQARYPQAAAEFQRQSQTYPEGSLAVDALFMNAECAFKQDEFEAAFAGYQAARQRLEAQPQTAASDQVKVLIYLHGAQCLREKQAWQQAQTWLEVITKRYPESSYIATAMYELGYAKQKQGDLDGALELYAEVANNYRNEIGARARFMMGELYFAQRDFVKAIPEFQRVMYGFGGDKAPEEIKNWQVKSAFEAARCSEVLIENLRGDAREKIIQTATEFYDFIVEKHAAHELAAQAQTRLGELQKLR